MKRTRVILADDHILLAEALEKLLEPEFEVVGIFHDGLTLTRSASELDPDVIVLDIVMPNMNGLTAGQLLKRLMPQVKLIYLTAYQDPDVAAEAFRLGASGYLVKNSAASELVRAIREAVRGGTYMTSLMSKDVVGPYTQNFERTLEPRQLTLRQKEVLQLLAEGRTMKEIAFMLDLSPRTVAFHKYRIMKKLGLRSRADLIEYAVRNSVVSE